MTQHPSIRLSPLQSQTTPPPLFPHQKEGIDFLEKKGGKAILAFEQGLGKTRCALSFLRNKKVRTLVVCPSGIKYNWADEIEKWCDGKIVALHSPGCSKSAQRKYAKRNIHLFKDAEYESSIEWDFLIVSYKSLDAFVPFHKHDAIIIDECHRISNPDSIQTFNVRRVAMNKEIIIGLSGTPVRNKPEEFWGTLNMIAPHIFPSYIAYIKNFCGAKQVWIKNRVLVWRPTRATNVKQLNKLLQHVMLRVTKDDVDLSIPPKEEVVKWITLPYTQSIDKNEEDIKILAKLYAELSTMKCNAVIRSLDRYPKPVVIFHHHKEFSRYFLQHYPGTDVINGHTRDHKRADIIRRFQSGDVPILLASTKAASEGINLTAAKSLILAEREWVPADEEQAIARAHRVGLKWPLEVYIINIKRTLDEHIHWINANKRNVIGGVVDGKKVESIVKRKVMERMKTWVN